MATTAVANSSSKFRQQCALIASHLLKDWVGEERAMEATGRLSCALASAAASARDPAAFYDCTPASIGNVIAISALTGIMPSTGRNALAYAIPRAPRKGETPVLGYQLSHRGVAALARRCGQSLIAIPIGYDDEIEVDNYGGAKVIGRDIDNPPTCEEDLRGVITVVRELRTGLVNSCGWVAKKLILKRREMSDAWKYAESKGTDWAIDKSPWHKWFVEQAMKTGMHYSVGRGWCVIDDTESVRALAMDEASDNSTVTVDGQVESKRISNMEELTNQLEELDRQDEESVNTETGEVDASLFDKSKNAAEA